MTKTLIFILTLAFTGSASAITFQQLPGNTAAPFNATRIGPSTTYTTPPEVKPVFTTTPLAETAIQSLAAFRGAFNPINIAGTVGQVIVVNAIQDGINSLRAQIGVNNKNYPAPQGWTNSLTPPSTAVLSAKWSGAAGDVYDSPQSACASRNVNSIAVFVSSTVYDCQYNGGSIAATTLSSACPAGYTQSGSSCNLTSPTLVKWPSDGQPTYYQTPFGFALHPNDPDTSNQPTFPTSRTGTDQYGNPASEQITPNNIGGVDIVRREESVNPANGQPITHEIKITTNDFGVVTNVYETSYNSTLSNVSSSSVITNNNSSSSNVDVSALNKESTQLEIKQKLTVEDNQPQPATLVQPVEQKYTDKIAEVTSASTDLSNNPASQLTPVPYWTFASGSCYPVEFNAGLFGKVSFQSFCTIYDEHIRSLIVFMFGVWGVLHVFGYWSEMVKEL